MNPGLRCVLDTNVVLSALVFQGNTFAPIRRAWQAQMILPLASRETIEELIRVLAYPKFKLSANDQQELLADYLPYCKTVVLPARRPKVPRCRDANDEMLLELAVSGKAKVLVTGDADLLALADQSSFKILNPQQFLMSVSPL